MTVIRNGLVFGAGGFAENDLAFDGGIITEIAPAGTLNGDIYDAGGAYVTPGFIDIHTHGCVNSDFCDADPDGIEKMLAYYGRNGVTSVLLTTMSYGEEVLDSITRVALRYFGKKGYGAVLRGVNMEGPFINEAKRGAQNPDYIMSPDASLFDRLNAAFGSNIRLLNLAPELPGSIDLIRHAAKSCTVSIAHTTADYDCASSAFAAGARNVTHLFNAMPGFGHRAPGVVGAAFDAAEYVEIVSDGVHLHPSVVRAVFRMFGPRRVCLISDSIRGTGMPNGEYELGGQAIVIKDGRSNLVNGGAIAGSAMNLADCFRQAVSFCVPLEDALRAATFNPADSVSIAAETGSLEPGKDADILIMDAGLRLLDVFIGGERFESPET